MFFGRFRKKKHVPAPEPATKKKTAKKRTPRAVNKQDIERILKEIISTREVLLQEMNRIPDSVSGLLVDRITQPLKQFLSQELSAQQAIKQPVPEGLSSNQAVPTLEQAVDEMKARLENLSQRHMKILNVLVQNRDSWLDYEEIGSFCTPQLTGSCIRGYVADLINTYTIPIEKKAFGRRSKVKISPRGLKQIAITKLDG